MLKSRLSVLGVNNRYDSGLMPAAALEANRLASIAGKVADGRRLAVEDGVALFETPDIWTVCSLADRVRRRLHGDLAYYNINRHLNYSNVCALSCTFCSFYRKAGQAGDLTATRQIVEQLDCDDPAVRILAISTLERLTGETYEYRFDDPPYLRRAAIKRWQEALGSGNG